MLKTLTIGDIHGRNNWRKIVNEYANDVDKIIFTGDYADSYESEKISRRSTLKEVYAIFDFYENNKDKTIILGGNHDFHYYKDPYFYNCSRYDRKNLNNLTELYQHYKKDIKVCFKYKNYIWTHAGILKPWINQYRNIIFNPMGLREDFSNIDIVLNELIYSKNFWILEDISFHRKGNELYGSPIWADEDEFKEERLIENHHQIVGHSKVINITSNQYNNKSITFVDVLAYETKGYFLDIS
jgi:predicted phosphodiesterase